MDALRRLDPATFPTASAARRALRRGAVTCGGRTLRCGDAVPAELASLRVATPGTGGADDPAPRHNGEPLRPRVLLEDDVLAVVLKPAGVPTHGRQRRSLRGALPFCLEPSSAADALDAPQPVHRLDQQTSGLVVVGKTLGAVRAMSAAFAERRVSKTYDALVVGEELDGEEGVVDLALDGRPSRTRWRVVSRAPSLRLGTVTHVRAFPETGRKHQIRRHLASLGAPVIGDPLYSRDDATRLRGQGMFLFAAELVLPHPTRAGEEVHAAAPPPEKFAKLMRRERARYERLAPAS